MIILGDIISISKMTTGMLFAAPSSQDDRKGGCVNQLSVELEYSNLDRGNSPSSFS